ncbi:MAG TPA: rhodanese-like domain-containing protein, partial [Terriglobia bacterium]|nr:rhodanese-like domain-containing protein [Terriglobia bacterium]
IQGKYATWSGTMLDRTKPIIVVAEPGREEEAILRLGRIGFDDVKGFLKGGLDSLNSRPDLIRRIERVTAVALSELSQSPEPPSIVDVRSEKEWNAGHIPGSLNIPLNHLREKIADLPTDRLTVVHCEGGYRSAIAVSVFAQMGYTHVMDLVGGFKAWAASQLPIEKGSATATTTAS